MFSWLSLHPWLKIVDECLNVNNVNDLSTPASSGSTPASLTGDDSAIDTSTINIGDNGLGTEDYTKIFINEDLTRNRQTLLYQCRIAKREKKIQDAWSFDGSILIKSNAGTIIQIQNKTDLDSVQQ